jgi:hypothetical protein
MDLSKLKALELPTEEIEIEILGESQKVKVSALDDDAALRISSIASGDLDDGQKESMVRRIVLEKGIVPPLSDDDIALLLSRSVSAVTPILTTALKLTKDFVAVRESIREEAKKNSNPVLQTSTSD